VTVYAPDDAMTPERWRRLERVIDAALDLAPAERPAFVAGACAGDGGLRAEVERFLAAEAAAGGFLEAPLAEHADRLLAALRAEEASWDALATGGRRVGPYRVVRELGRGGMGAVFLAERADGQFEQRVALKLIRRNRVSDQVVRRFLAERRILARLQHPGIARLLDGGVTADGLPYFALEYVEGGVALTDFCAARRSSVEERLGLFIEVCAAVQYAHRNLVVHRDLKPGNVLVAPDGRVRLVDFGIAKLLGGDGDGGSGDATATAWGPRPMTPPYAAPEQVLGGPITTATDVYALGVLLYELLTGRLPLRPKSPALIDLQRAVLEDEPERPSKAVLQAPAGDGAAEADAGGAGRRAGEVERARLARRLRGDLDAVVLAALAKEPERRYPSVDALVDDLRRHLAGLPIAARRAGALDRAGRFVRRHQVGVGAAALVALSLAGGAAGTWWQAREALAAARRAEEVKSFLLGIFEVSDPDQARGETLTARELLDRGARRIEAELAGQPAVEAEMLAVVGEVYRRLGAFAAARPPLVRSLELRRAALGPGHPLVGETLLRLADVDHTAGDLDRAEGEYLEALELLREGYGEDGAETLRAESYLARLRYDRGDTDRAEAGLRRALDGQRRALGEDHPETVETVNALARVLFARGDLAGAEPLFRRVAEVRRRRHGDLHTSVSEALVNLASVRNLRGDFEAAEALYRQALAIDRRLLPGHPDLAVGLNNLAALLARRGRFAEAEGLAREALAIAEATFGRDQPQSAVYLHGLAKVLRLSGAHAEAAPLARRAVALAEAALGPGHPNAALARVSLARVLVHLGETAEAEELFRGALAVFRERLPEGDPRTADGLAGLGVLLAATGRPAEAAPLLRQALAAARGPDDPVAGEAAAALAKLTAAGG
jgi:serine/threonine-protein kinase